MPSHTSVVAIIVMKENFRSLTQGIAKYQPAKNDFKIVRWKYFYPFNQVYTEFLVGDIVMFVDKFVVENLEQYINVSYACIIAIGDPNQEFTANEIPISVPHCMFHLLIPKSSKQSTKSSTVPNESTTTTSDSLTLLNTNPNMVQNQKGNKKLADLALNCLKPDVVNDIQEKDNHIEDASEKKDLEDLINQDIEGNNNKLGK
ncbi:32913_t:CDS:2 [Gigaspora margarita]|uniref:32913_t:CDS:1 n=1 Tax=Gigaspora margarita TaxID=4874 RepID=A0ABN7W9J0_GIGMA|nr:32913_t:CDS:2 [Gigaspora margarita]